MPERHDKTPPTPMLELELERFLPYRLSVLSNRISAAVANTYAERFGIGITEWRLIAVLGRFNGLSANEVAERTAMDKVAVSRAVARLIAGGLVERDTHGDDRRRSVLALSRAGRRMHARIAPLALAIEQKLLASLDDEERTRLAQLLDKLAAGVTRLGEG
ncbi:MarR family transcriptional regulator [Lysobacter pythonis]|uniref:MarR family transcriptional regulator n=1 Tax=Solilutibacter pythonis TaxID=2483112 RepID=A0A3M2I2K2_9GAMM|nr:MarR family transcriptional regulator [Lysobacter pythonis]RMH93442.1 MarR family transcriptional regulator [Lysobacter pythonis]